MRRRFCALFADTENYRERDRERNTYIDTDKERHREKKEKKTHDFTQVTGGKLMAKEGFQWFLSGISMSYSDLEVCENIEYIGVPSVC